VLTCIGAFGSKFNEPGRGLLVQRLIEKVSEFTITMTPGRIHTYTLPPDSEIDHGRSFPLIHQKLDFVLNLHVICA
jgi:hypothetical protein